MKIGFTVNGAPVDVDVALGETLMDVTRRLGWKGVKNGCAAGDCGTCAVLLDGRAINACMVLAVRAAGRQVTTIEGLAGRDGLHPLQEAAIASGAVQCGFCTPGMLMVALDLLARRPDPSDHEIREALAGNLCRCTGYVKVIDAIAIAADQLRQGGTVGD